MTIVVGVVDHPQQQVGGYAANPAILAGSGAKWVRLPLDWFALEASNGVYTTAAVTALKTAYNAAGLKVLWNPQNTPGWANGSLGQFVPPTNPADFATFMAHMAATYPGETWELFNEPSTNVFFLPGGQTALQFNPAFTYPQQMAWYASFYVPIVQAAYTAMKAADPTCTVVAGVQGVLDPTFYQACIAAGMLGYFDHYSAHVYGDPSPSPDPTTVFGPQLNTLQAARAAAGDTTKLILSECGWSAYTPALATPPIGQMVAPSIGSTYAAQASYTANWLAGLNARGDIPLVFVYQLLDTLATPSGVSATDYQAFFGLASFAGTPKPVYNLIASMVAAGFAPPPRYVAGTHRQRRAR